MRQRKEIQEMLRTMIQTKQVVKTKKEAGKVHALYPDTQTVPRMLLPLPPHGRYFLLV